MAETPRPPKQNPVLLKNKADNKAEMTAAYGKQNMRKKPVPTKAMGRGK